MITFIPAKINIGLNIVARRPDGYHNLETLFYPIGKHNGTHSCPYPFGDILEITPSQTGRMEFSFTGNAIDCPEEKNLVVKAAGLFTTRLKEDKDTTLPPLLIHLDKHIPDGAGIGGGSADATFTRRMLNCLCPSPFDDETMKEMATSLGADCPFFLHDIPMIGEGIGEILTPFPPILEGKWLLLVKPPVYISTREAFANISVRASERPLSELLRQPISHWKGGVHNDFEISLQDRFPQLGEIKKLLYNTGALYASMSGSGSSLYGIYETAKDCHSAATTMKRELPEAASYEILL